MNVDHGLIKIRSPESDVTLTINSVHDSGYIVAKGLTIYIPDDLKDKLNVVRVSSLSTSDEHLPNVPSIFVDCAMEPLVHYLSRFDILKMQILSKKGQRRS
mmetsp:Transcript_11449/g.19364  ORF Transcript_11449/g.19364 Transcript_11449/m.19364 type:complete len:101 (-) Transcript_11449:34-336(-)